MRFGRSDLRISAASTAAYFKSGFVFILWKGSV